MMVFLFAAVAIAAAMWWRRRHSTSSGLGRYVTGPAVRWAAALVGLRRTRPADVQYAITRQILALRTIGVSGTIHIPHCIEVFVGDEDWRDLSGTLGWTADEVAAAVRNRAAQLGWVVTEPIDVTITYHADSRRLLPTVHVTEPTHVRTTDHDAAADELPATGPLAPSCRAGAAYDITGPTPSARRHWHGRRTGGDELPRTIAVDDLPPTQALPDLLLAATDRSRPDIVGDAGTDSILVGRGPDADVRIPDRTVSRAHCLLFRRGGHWHIDDLSSSNGTFVNGEPVTGPKRLVDGDLVAIGTDARYRLR